MYLIPKVDEGSRYLQLGKDPKVFYKLDRTQKWTMEGVYKENDSYMMMLSAPDLPISIALDCETIMKMFFLYLDPSPVSSVEELIQICMQIAG